MHDDRNTRYPILLLEILSPSTASTDRGAKFVEYRTIFTLREYVLIDSTKVAIDVYRRTERGWAIESFGPGDRIAFESIALEISIEALYEGLNLGQLERAVLNANEADT